MPARADEYAIGKHATVPDGDVIYRVKMHSMAKVYVVADRQTRMWLSFKPTALIDGRVRADANSFCPAQPLR
ncbi:hypothetical protein GCM10009849_11930 [Sinomonas flava]|uniref:Uncharacterized protein n=1 Tax=Sinomonas flava TaxID=496857 RepID=A0ABN3BPM8_9MICC